jgi:hypothetical protein
MDDASPIRAISYPRAMQKYESAIKRVLPENFI